MPAPALAMTRDRRPPDDPDVLSYGPVELQVTDLDRSVAFWTKALGLRVREQDGSAHLGTLADAARLLRYEIRAADPTLVATMRSRLGPGLDKGLLAVNDPAGSQLLLTENTAAAG